MSLYCVKCKSKTKNLNLRSAMSSNGKPMVKAQCAKCGTQKNQFISPSALAPTRMGKGKKGGFLGKIASWLF